MAKQRIVNANTRVGKRGDKEERPGLREFSDRYVGPQTRVRIEADRAKAPQSERSLSSKGAALTRSAEHKDALTAPRITATDTRQMATERTTAPERVSVFQPVRLKEQDPRKIQEPWVEMKAMPPDEATKKRLGLR